MSKASLITLAALSLVATAASAQISPGSTNRIGSQPLIQSPGGAPPSDRSPKRKIDDEYAHGRAIVAGKARGLEPVQVCLNIGGQLLAMLDARSHELRTFKTRSELGQAIHDCSSSGQPQLAEVLEPKDVAAVVHFLDERLDLELEDED